MTGRTFKQRYYGHKSDFKNADCSRKKRAEAGAAKKGTALAEKIWDLKELGKEFNIKWEIIDRSYPYRVGAKVCDLCRTEKMHIALGRKGFIEIPPDCELLNKRREIFSKCPHMAKFSLAAAKSDSAN